MPGACWRTHSRFRLSWVCQEQPDFIAAARQRDSRRIQSTGGGRAPKIGQFKRTALIEEEAGVVVGTSLVENSLAILRAGTAGSTKSCTFLFHNNHVLHASKLFANLSYA